MTKKILLGLCLGLLCFKPTKAQKVVNEKARIAYTHLPSVGLADDIGTYRVFLALSGSQYKGILDAEQVAYGVNLPGFEKVNENYDLELSLWLSNFTVVEKEPKTLTRTHKNKKTGVVTTTYTYYYSISARFPAWIRARTYDGQQVWQKDISTTKQLYSETTKEFNTVRDRDVYWRNNSENFLRDMQNDLINGYISSANKLLADLAFRPLYYDLSFARVEPKKKSSFSYESFDEAWEITQAAIQERDRSDINTGNDKFAQAIKLWRSEAERLEPDNKKARINQKVASSAYLNCALACIWINKFELAEEYLALANGLKGGGLRANKIEKIYNFRKGQFTMYPNWTGQREIAPRQGVATIYQETPDAKLVAHNQRMMAAQSMAANQQQGNQTRGSTSNTTLGDLVNLVEGTTELIKTIDGESTANTNNQPNQAKQNNQSMSLASPGNNAQQLSYESVKGPMSASLAATPVGEREKFLVAHPWKLSKIEYINPNGQLQTRAIQDSCLLQENHQFQLDKQYFKTALGPCTPEGSPSMQWVSFDYESIIINEAGGPRTLRLLDLNNYILVLETVTHSNQKPLERYTYIKAD